MNTQNPIHFALLAAASLFTVAAFAGKPGSNPPPPQPPPSSGTLVLDYLYPGDTISENWGLTVTPSGIIYASGSTWPGFRGLVLGSGDSGSSWFLLDDFCPLGRSVYCWDQCGSIASDTAGNLYVTGFTMDNDFIQPDQWYVRRSTDGGTTWTTVDDFVMDGLPGGISGSDVTGITVDPVGDVYVSGWNKQVWTIRKGVGGAPFSTVDVMPNSYPYSVFAHPTAGIFAVGRRTVVIKSKSSSAWTVRRSTDSGATWQTVETLQLSSGVGATALGIGTDALGNLYVVGSAVTTSRGSAISHWLVRKSTDGGNSWITVDDFVPGSGVEARRFAATPNGDLYVTGRTLDAQGIARWIVRKNPGGTGTWTTIDDYQYAPAASTEPHAIAADASGNLFLGGTGQDALGNVHWIIKKY